MRRLLLAAACAAPLLGGVLALPPQPAAALASRPCTQWTSGRFLYTHCQYADGQHVLLVTAPGYWHEYYWFE